MAKLAKIEINRTEKFELFILGGFFLFSLFNIVFKKYDYGAGWPNVLLLAVILAVIVFASFRIKREKAPLEKIFLGIFAGSMILSFIFSQTRNIGFSEVLAFLCGISLYLIFAHRQNKWLHRFLQIVALGATVAAIMGLLSYIFQPEPRMFGPFFNIFSQANKWPNAFALFLLMSWPIFLLLPDKKRTWGFIFPLSLVLAALLLTYSRGALIAFSGQVVLILIYFLRKVRWQTVLYTLVTILFSIGIFFGANFLRSFNEDVISITERAGFANEEKLTSINERMEFFKGAIELIKEKPLFGFGPFSFRQAYNPIQTTFLANADHPHNIFLKIGAENGLISLAAFFGFLITVLVFIFKRFKNLSSEKRITVYVLLTSLLGAMAHSMIDYNFNFAVNLFLFFIFLALLRSLLIDVPKMKMRRNIGTTIFSVLLGLIAMYEGAIFDGSYLLDEDLMRYSLFPRNFYITQAEEAIEENNYPEAFQLTEKQISLNTLDAQSYYLQGVVYCQAPHTDYMIDMMMCFKSFEKALALNPMNEWRYYVDYLKTGKTLGLTRENEYAIWLDKAITLMPQYFDFVENNVHYTALTKNVEAASEVVDIILPYLDNSEVLSTRENREKMLQTAENLRNKLN